MTRIIYTDSRYKPKRKSKKPKGEVAKKYKAPFKELKTSLYSSHRSVFPEIKSKETSGFVPTMKMQPKYEGEMAERERKAQEEIERKKKMVAPLYNKGGYQYVGDAPPEIVKNLGRKV